MEEFKSAHSKMFGKQQVTQSSEPDQDSDQLVIERSSRNEKSVTSRSVIETTGMDEDGLESCSSSSSGISSVSSSSSSGSVVKKVVMFASDTNQVIKSGLKRSAPIRGGHILKNVQVVNGDHVAPIAATRNTTTGDRVTILRTSVSSNKKSPAPPPPPPLPPSLDSVPENSSFDADNDQEYRIQSDQRQSGANQKKHSSPLVTISSYTSQERMITKNTQVSKTGINNNQIKPLSIRINCKLPDDE